MDKDKFEWASIYESGDCSIRVKDASAEYDTGVWQCQVTASDFTQKDTLISLGGFLSIRTQPESVKIFVNNESFHSRAVFNVKAGKLIDLKCEANGGNPTPSLIWSINNVNTSTDPSVMIRSEGGLKTTSSTISVPINKDDNLSEIRCIVVQKC
jgi:hypothetical protein